MFDRRERAHSRESGFVATTLLHGPVVIGVPRIGQAFIELHAEVFEGRERSANEQTNMVNGSATSKCLREIWSWPRRKMMTP